MKFTTGFWAVAALAFSASTLYADSPRGTVVMIGKGAASSPPEFVSLSIKVSSICYNTSQDAQAANAKLSNAVLAVLEGFKKGERDKIVATGGANIRQTETTQIGLDSKVLCELKWRSENTLRISMARIEDLPSLQDKIFTELDQSADLNPDRVDQTYAEVGRPDFSLYPETSVKLRNDAEGLAYDDAKQQLTSLQSRCNFQNLQLISIVPPEYSFVAKRAGEVVAASYSGPMIPDEMEVHASLRMEWTYTPSAACKQSSKL